MTSLQTTTYQEELYQLTPRVLIVVPTNWDAINEDEKTLLNKILGSVKLSLARVQVISLSTFSLDEVQSYAATRIISFGATLKPDAPLYERIIVGESQLIIAENFSLLDDAKKKSLWLALRQMFGV